MAEKEKERARPLTVAEVADRLRCSRLMVYRLLGRGELHHFTVGNRKRVPAEEVEAYITRNMQ